MFPSEDWRWRHQGCRLDAAESRSHRPGRPFAPSRGRMQSTLAKAVLGMPLTCSSCSEWGIRCGQRLLPRLDDAIDGMLEQPASFAVNQILRPRHTIKINCI